MHCALDGKLIFQASAPLYVHPKTQNIKSNCFVHEKKSNSVDLHHLLNRL